MFKNSLMYIWHQQDDLCALVVTPPWLSLQLPRFNATTGAKTHQPYVVPGMLRLPIFVDAASQAVVWHAYAVHSIIRHHGATFHAGHYTVMARGRSDFILDDRPPKKASPQDRDDTSRSMCVLILCDATSTSLSRDLSRADADCSQHGADRSDRIHGEGRNAGCLANFISWKSG